MEGLRREDFKISFGMNQEVKVFHAKSDSRVAWNETKNDPIDKKNVLTHFARNEKFITWLLQEFWVGE